jgi:hypothetical protein
MTPIERTNKKSRSGNWLWLFRCPKCEKIVEKQRGNGVAANSCGCQRYVRTCKHGATLRNKPLFNVYLAMLYRCQNKNNPRYPRYGGRGITVTADWIQNPHAFMDWAEEAGYRRGLTLDRINNDVGYSPENCRWVTTQINNQNTGQTRLNANVIREIKKMMARGVRNKEIEEITGVPNDRISRIRHGLVWGNINIQ